jgi:hypothetical protein
MKKFTLLFITLYTIIVALAQDTTKVQERKKKFIPDSNRTSNTLVYKLYSLTQLTLQDTPQKPDSSLFNFENYNPDYNIHYDRYFFTQSTGMAGRWHRRYYFGTEDRFINTQTQWTADLSGYYTWLILPDSLPLINTFSPYSRIQYQQGKRQLQITDALFAVNVTPQWNIQGGYHRLTWLGMYKNNNTDVRNAYFNSFYYALNKRFFAYQYLIFNELKQAENGGIAIDSSTVDFFEKDVQVINTFGKSLTKNNFAGSKIGYQWIRNNTHTLQSTLQYQLDFLFRLTNMEKVLPIYSQYTTKQEKYISQFGFWQQQYGAGIQYKFRNIFSQNVEWLRTYTKTPKAMLYKNTNELFPKFVNVDILRFSNQFDLGDSSKHITLQNQFVKHFNPTMNYQQIQSKLNGKYNFLTIYCDIIQQNGYLLNKIVPLPETDTNTIQLSALRENAEVFFVHPRVGMAFSKTGMFNLGFFNNRFNQTNYQGFTASFQLRFQKWNIVQNVVYYTKNEINNVPNTIQTKFFYADYLFKKKMLCHIGFNTYYTGKYQAFCYDIFYDNIFSNANVYQNSIYPAHTGDYLRIDPFVNFSIKRASFYIRFTNITESLLGKKGYFTTPFYQMEERALGFSFSWRFFD